jgi:hypothetical protein
MGAPRGSRIIDSTSVRDIHPAIPHRLEFPHERLA